jgi:hypothetical protein
MYSSLVREQEGDHPSRLGIFDKDRPYGMIHISSDHTPYPPDTFR